MKWSIEQRTRVTFILVILLVIIIGYSSYRSTINFISANQTVLQTRNILDELQSTLASVQDVQNSQLNYMVTGNELYLQQYDSLNGQVVQHITNLKQLTASEPQQQERLENLNRFTLRWLAQIDQVILTQRQNGIEQARTLAANVQLNTLMAQVRTILNVISTDEQAQLSQNRLIQAAQREQYTLATFAVLTLVMVGLLVLGYFRIHRDLRSRRRIEQQLQEERTLLRTMIDTLPDFIFVKDTSLRLVLANRAHVELVGAKTPDEIIGKTDAELFPATFVPQYVADEKTILQTGNPLVNHEEPTASSTGEQKVVLTTKVPIRNNAGEIIQIAGISHDITERKHAEEEINLLNRNLQLQTAKLETTNKELEAFSYSISHDLRAPLRAIDGFSRILMDDYSGNMAPEGVRYLEKVRANAHRMSELIDDLLRFSRLSRQELHKQRVQPADLVHQVLDDDLRAEQENRKIDITIGEMPPCQADPLLLRQVYANLLSNALKFTSKCEVAKIEIGAKCENGDKIYFVKDNGAGFDQQYVDKLFGVFQRLHRVEDYEGTGVGLAIVQRVISRHGGNIWAEGVMNEGAAFYFTLEENHVNTSH